MKKSILIIITILCTAFIYGQSMNSAKNQNETFQPSSLAKMNPNPQFIVVVDSTSYKVDKYLDYEIESEWIESINVLKDPTSKKLYGSENGIIFIYIKKEYSKNALMEIEKEIGN